MSVADPNDAAPALAYLDTIDVFLHTSVDDPAYDSLADQLDELWWKMTPAEQAIIARAVATHTPKVRR